MEIVIPVTKISINIDSSDSHGHPTFLTLWTVFVPVFSSARGLQRRRTTDCLDPCPRLVAVVFLNKPSTQLYYQYKSVSMQQDWPFLFHLLWLLQNTSWVFSFLETLVYSWCKPNKVAVSGSPPKILSGPDETWTWESEQKLEGQRRFTGSWNQKSRQFLCQRERLCSVRARWLQSIWPRPSLCTETIIRWCHTKEVWAPQ